MIDRIIHFSVYQRLYVLILTVLVAIAGWISFNRMSIDAVPDITNPQVQVYAQVEGLAPEEIERNVTFPIESAMGGISGVTEVRSITRFGISQVTIVFEDDEDIYRARQLVTERLQTVGNQLPANVHPKLGPVSTGLGEIYFYAIEPEKVATGSERLTQLMELRGIQDWYVKPRLLTVKGVAEVNTIGGLEKQFHIQPDPKKMSYYALHFSELVDALEATNRNVGGGYVQQTADQFLVQGVGLLTSIEEIENTPVKTLESFKPVAVKDVAKVTLASELRTGAAVVQGNEAVVGTVFMLIGENGRTVSTRVRERLNEISSGLPPGYRLKTLYDRSVLVNQSLGTVEHNLLVGAALVIIVLLILLGNVRAAVITALTIPLSLLITFIAMKWQGISANLLSLGALDFGIIVDGAVIILDHCVHNIHKRTGELKRSLSSQEVQDTVYHSAVEIRGAAGFGELIVVVAFLPVLGLTGIEGKMFIPMAATFAIAVFSALILSFTTVPALASLLLSGSAKDSEPKLMSTLRAGYLRVLTRSLSARGRTLAFTGIVFALSVALFTTLGGEFVPQMDEGSRTFQFVRPVNVSLNHSLDLERKCHEIIMKRPEVENTFTRIGTAEVATDPMGVNLSDTFVMFKDKATWPDPDKTWTAVAAEIAEEISETIPGQRVLISQPIQMRFNELLEGTRADVSVKVFGEDMETLVKLTEQIAGVVRKVPGAADVEAELRGTSPVLKIIPKANLLGSLGVPKREVLEAVNIAIGGEEVGSIYEGVRKYPLIVRMNEADRSNLDAIRSLPVSVGANIVHPLSAVAQVQFDEAYSVVNREQAKRRAAVMVNIRGRDTQSFVEEAEALVRSSVPIPAGFYVEWGGNFKNLQQAKARLMVFAPLAIFLVLLMIYLAFGNVVQTLLVFCCVPLALIGGVVNLWLHNMPFSISAAVGFIALSGIVTLNGVVLLNVFNELHKKGESGTALVISGAALRVRAVLMTALVAIFGFIPMMLSTGIGAEVQRPLATVVVGGLVSSTFLTLLVVPILFTIFERQMYRKWSFPFTKSRTKPK